MEQDLAEKKHIKKKSINTLTNYCHQFDYVIPHLNFSPHYAKISSSLLAWPPNKQSPAWNVKFDAKKQF